MKAALILLALTFPTIAGELPRLDPEAWCDGVRSRSQGNGDVARHACIEREQDAYEALKGEWPEATDPEQSLAVRKNVGNNSGNSYDSLRAVLRAEVTRDAIKRRMEEQRRPNGFKFD